MARRYREYSLTKRKNGLWQASFMKDGHRIYLYDRDRDRAVERVTKAKTAPPSPPPSSAVSAELSGWISAVTPTLRPQTLVSYANIVNHHLIPAFADKTLDTLTETDIERYIATKLAGGLSTRTVQYHHRIISLVLKRAELAHRVTYNVATRVKAPAPNPDEIFPLSRAEVRKLLDGTEGQDRNIYALAIFGGLRIGELLALRWRHVDLAAGTLTVVESVARVKGRSAIVAPKSKASRRTISLPPQALDALRDQQERVRGELVFSTDDGKLLIASTVGGQFQAHLKRLRIPERRFHDLRHTCATLMLGSGGHLDDVKRYLGHSSIKLTSDTYGHLDVVRQRQVVDFLGAAV